MEYELIHNKEMQEIVTKQLELNDGYCFRVPEAKGNPDWKCMCKDFIENTEVGDLCRCLLYKKISN